MAKIGVVTYSFTKDNYGQVLQFLATKIFLEGLGHNVNLLYTKGHKRSLLIKIYGYLKRLVGRHKKTNETYKSLSQKELEKQLVFDEWAKVTDEKEKKNPRLFEKFRSKHFNIVKGSYEKILNSGYDAICVGSDQTWSCPSELYMLGWVNGDAKKFSIAPSVGHKQYTQEEIKGIVPWIKSFDFITVRENNGLDLVKKTGRHDAIKILDPTLLVDYSSYKKYSKCLPQHRPYVFVYLLGGEISVSVESIVDFCKKNGFEVKYVESQGRNENIDSIPATVEEWLGLMDNASYVITNSFHGMAFALIYHKPFLVFPLIGIMEDMNERVYNLAETTGLKERIYKGNLQLLFSTIDWSIADKIRIDNQRTLSCMISKLLS